MRITIIKDVSRFQRECFTFWIDSPQGADDSLRVVFDNRRSEERTTPRHSWRVTSEWDRLRNGSRSPETMIARQRVTPEIEAQVMEQLHQRVRFVYGNEP